MRREQPHSERRKVAGRVAYAVISAGLMWAFLTFVGKPIESWLLWLFVTMAFLIALAFHGKVD